jgi:fatty acid amide hydrolase
LRADDVEACIARIEEVNPALNAVVVKRYDEARREARAASGPLAGVPITVKECLDVAGTPSTFGIPSRAGRLAIADDPVVARLRAAGAVVVAKTNVAQLLIFIETDNPVYGRTQNPWDPARTPGGSSGGEAAILAAGGPRLGVGTDIGGSLRVPAHFCGIASLKPTTGRLPDVGDGSVPLGQRAIPSQVGPMARRVADVALALEIMNGGRDAVDDDGRPRPLGDPAGVALGALRVACFDDDGTLPAAPALRRAVREAAQILRDAGATVVDWRPPEPAEAVFLLYALLTGDGGRGIRRVLGGDARDRRVKVLELLAASPRPLRAALRRVLPLAGRGKAAGLLDAFGHTHVDDHWRLVERLEAYRARWRRALDEGGFDLVLSPPCALPALRHGASEDLGVAGAYACVYNVLGYPAGVVPVTRVRPGEESDRPPPSDRVDRAARATEEGSAGLPVGVQLAARPWREHVALAAMAAIERAVVPVVAGR